MILLRSQKTQPKPKPGDIIGFSGDSWLSVGINLATYGIPFWSLSHVGVVGEYDGEYDGELLVFESTEQSDLPCAIQGKPVCGTQAHRLDECVEAYCGKVWLYPLYRSLYAKERKRLNTFLRKYIGTNYDAIGAFRSAGVGWSWLESKLRRADLSSLFCSEYCAAAHVSVGIFRTDHVSRWSPNRLVRTERRRGILLKPWRLK